MPPPFCVLKKLLETHFVCLAVSLPSLHPVPCLQMHKHSEMGFPSPPCCQGIFVFSFTYPCARAVILVQDIVWHFGIGEILRYPNELKKCGESMHEALKTS